MPFLLPNQQRQRTEGLSNTTNTHTHLTALFPGLPGRACTRKVKAIWILLKQEIVSGSGISWATCKSAPRSRQITCQYPTTQGFFTGRMPFLPPNQQRQSTEGNLSNTTNRGQKCGMTVQPECDIFNLGLNAAPPTVFHLFCRMTNH